MADPDEPRSFAHANYLAEQKRFATLFEAFLVSLETPVETRRLQAASTLTWLSDIVLGLRSQGVL
jgi:hypothetical protein